jgi:UDP-N-acetylglucosamine--N-acetylmuramyl-(pentapeptide) pyrophosphoryl-undecaprenol N-acetylglucosamine transferase
LTKVLYGVSPIGLGHASRAVAVGSELAARGADVVFASGGPAALLLRSYGFDVREVVSEPNPTLWRGRNVFPSLWYLRYWRGYRRSKARTGRLRNVVRPDVVVGDEEFSVLDPEGLGGRRAIMVSDELDLGFAKTFISRIIERRVERWYGELQRSVSLLVVPDFGTDEGNIWHSGPMVRKVTAGRTETLQSLLLPPEKRLVLVSLSGSGSGAYLVPGVEEAVAQLGLDVTVAVAGRRASRGDGSIRQLGFVRDAQNLVAAADLVVSLAGKSTIDEAYSSGTPIITIPLKDHFEQESNARALGFTYGDIDRLGPLISERLGRRSEPRNYDGARRVAERILESG